MREFSDGASAGSSRCRNRSEVSGGRGHDSGSSDGADESGRGWRAGIFRTSTPADYARRSCPPQLRSISAGGRWRRVRVGIRAGGQVTTNFGRWPNYRQRSSFGDSRSRRWIGNRVHSRSSRRPLPAHETAGSRAGGLVTVLRGTLPLLCRPPAGAGRVTCLDGNAPCGARIGSGQRLSRDPLRRRLNASRRSVRATRLIPSSCTATIRHPDRNHSNGSVHTQAAAGARLFMNVFHLRIKIRSDCEAPVPPASPVSN